MRGSRFPMLKALVSAAVLLAAVLAASAQQRRQQDVELQAAIRTETVEGDLATAIRQYEAIATKYMSDRAIAATALVHMAECYQKLGDAQSRKIYERIIRDYGDQKDAVTLARTRLGGSAAAQGGAMVNVQKWTGSKVDVDGGVSQDGRYLSAVDWDTGDLVLHDLTSDTERRLTNKGSWAQSADFAEESAISRDGTQIAYTWFVESKLGCEIRLLNLGAGATTPRILVDNPAIRWIKVNDWSPDGKWLAVEVERKDRTVDIGVVSVGDGSLKMLKPVDPFGTTRMFFSPDGMFVAYDRRASGASEQRDVFVVSIDGGQEIPVVVHPAHDQVMGWSPDGRLLLFASDRAGSMGLWSLPFANGRPQGAPAFHKDLGNAFPTSLGLTRSGNLLYGVRINGVHIAVASVDFETGKVIEAPKQMVEGYVLDDRWPDWSRDGKNIVYVSGSQTRSMLLVKSVETGQIRPLPVQLARAERPRWSPDGSILVQGRDARGAQGIYRIDSRSGDSSPVVISKPGTSSGQFVMTPDGKLLYYRREPSDTPRSEPAIIERNLASGSERELVSGGDQLIGLSLSPDGRRIGFIERTGETSALYIMPVDGGLRRELFRVTRPAYLVNSGEWTPDGRHLVFAAYEGGKTTYWIIPSGGGTPVRLNLTTISAANSLRIHPDGRQVAFNAGSRTHEVWALENFLPSATTVKK